MTEESEYKEDPGLEEDEPESGEPERDVKLLVHWRDEALKT